MAAHTDLFGIATAAGGRAELREGVDILGALEGRAQARDFLFGYYGTPGTRRFKIMVRHKDWKYIYMANGGREQLFNLNEDPQELRNALVSHADIARQLRAKAAAACNRPGARESLDGAKLRSFPFEERRRERIISSTNREALQDFPTSRKTC